MACTIIHLIASCLALAGIVVLQIALLSSWLSSACLWSNVESSSPRLPGSIVPWTVEKKVRRLPDALIIGARKGGTRALLDAMALHPQIRAARREVHFFDQNDTYALGIDWYREQMPLSSAKQITVEKTPAYLASPLAPERVHAMNPDVKLIVILRNPVIRTISDFTQVLYTKLERNKTWPLFESVAFLQDGKTLDTFYKPVRNSLYAMHLANWLKFFPLEQFIFVDGDRFIGSPITELKRVERFLGIPEGITPDQLVYNTYKGFYCFKRRERRSARCLGTSKGRTHFPLSVKTRKLLSKNFRPYNEKLFRLINRRFDWS